MGNHYRTVMRTTFTIACSVVIISAFTFAQAQDSTLAKVDSRTNSESPSAKKTQPLLSAETSINEPNVSTAPAAFDLSAVKKTSDRSILNNKVAPNGEQLMMKKNKYFYLNEKGKKVKVKTSMLRDGAKHS
jgi:hypothetical protein